MSVGATAANVENQMRIGHLDKDDFAVQSLLLLGHSNSSGNTKFHVEDEVALEYKIDAGRYYPYITSEECPFINEIKEDFMGNTRHYCADLNFGNQNLWPEVLSEEMLKSVSRGQQSDIEKSTRRRADKIAISTMSIGGFSNMLDGCPSDHSHINEDLSNALLSSSLVLGSLSKSRKDSRRSECLSTSTQELPKRKRPILSPTKSNNYLESTPLTLVNPPQALDLPNHIKERKSSTERYRQRNHRRKQFFDSKLVKVVDLLQKYRLMMSAKVSQPNGCYYTASSGPLYPNPSFFMFYRQRLKASTTKTGTD